jgi:MoCo/4Fe-4S cofactor protein with predicted Tat translocation signal
MSSLSATSEFASDAGRARFALARGPAFWRSLEELADSEAFQHWLRRQHPQFADEFAVDRRRFLKFLGASLALAGVTACSHPPQD